MLLGLAAITFCITLINADSSNPIVQTPLGLIKGTTSTTVQGKTIYTFRGIRYAKPPVNELRYQPSEPVEAWNGTYDATHDGPLCPQPNTSPVSDDCLFLNVYTNTLPPDKVRLKRPVIVYIHGGGFYSGSSISTWAGPEYFLDHDIVLVTINYRLGSLGFLSTDNRWAPGNNGLKDQVLALHWLKENIASFGGNHNCVTICGHGVGGLSVTLHLVSPMSRGLFHRAIAMSGSALGQWSLPFGQYELAQKHAHSIGCLDGTFENMLNCFKSKTAEELGNSLSGLSEFGNDPVIKWKPVIEPKLNQERFLDEHPVVSAQKGNFAKVPIILGLTRREFAYLSFSVVNNSTLLTEMNNAFDVVAPIAFLYEKYISGNISDELRRYYLDDDERLSSKSRSGIGKLYADGLVGFGINRAAHLLSEKSTHAVYYYRFSYQGRYSNFHWPGSTIPYGVVHQDDLMYLFHISTKFPKFKTTDPEYQIVKKITKLFVNFAYTGDPTPSPDADLDNVTWKRFKPNNRRYLNIGKTLHMKKNLHRGRYAEWEKLFPLK